MFGGEPVEDDVHVLGVGNGAVEIGGQPEDAVSYSNLADPGQAFVITMGIVAEQLDLEA